MRTRTRQIDERFPLPVSEKAILTRAVRRFPKCLRNVPNWFVTEPYEVPGSMYFGRYSPVTLQPLRYDQAGDYVPLHIAIQTWKDHGHWFDGVGFHVTSPWVVLVVQNCVTPTGNVTKRAKAVIKRLHGHWEFTRNGKDIQGILSWPQRLQSRSGVVAGHPVFLCGEGVCGVTGRIVPGCGGDPASSDQDAFSVMLYEMATKSAVDVLARPRQDTKGGGGAKCEQLRLFDEP